MKASLKEAICHILQRLGLISDWVVEQGTSGIWTYRKWNSGIAECWGTKEKSITGVSKTAPFSGYCYSFGSINYPSDLFNSTPTGVVSCRTGDLYNVVSYSNVYGNNLSVELQSNASGTRTCYAYIYLIGLWKSFSGGGSA